MTRDPFAARLPAIHPFSIGVELPWHELGGFGVEHAPDFCKEVVGRGQCPGAQAWIGQID
ncbi:hypothetical protein SDC9_207357 [bioreactor metagenome]|uniref:Uncharacterized protein n=1 Tax=bioreactor metagenome TaxID=1076179 RepID=A0A645J875_9ZZZZ